MRIPRIAMVAATGVALVGTSVITAPGASAEDTSPPVISSVDVRPDPVGLYQKGSTRVTVDVAITDDVGVTSVRVLIGAWPRDWDTPDYPDFVETTASLVSGTAQDGTWRGTMTLDKSNLTGRWSSEVGVRDAADNGQWAGQVFDEGYDVPPVDNFYVKRNTMIRGFNVAEPAAKGSHIRMSGRLIRLDPDRGYVGYRNKTMHVLFRPAGTTTWRHRGTVTTNSLGYFTNSHTFRAWGDGTWKVRFDGTANYLPEASRGDYVNVR